VRRGAGSGSRLLAWVALPVLVAAVTIIAMGVHAHERQVQLGERLLSSYPQNIEADAALVRFAEAQARPLYASHCAGCHGAAMQGNSAIGAPSLIDGHWIWGNGSVFQIERILLYGIRTGQPKGLSVTDMPAYGLMGRLTSGQINELVQYMMKLNHRAYDADAANAGQALFSSDLSGCYDCHGADARGESDYGAPDLTANLWIYGGSAQSLYESIFSGRHGVMPGWQGKLSLLQFRALAVYIHERGVHGGERVTRASAGATYSRNAGAADGAD
jgi:cytochrome c oxidase cbb3-type subunit 3